MSGGLLLFHVTPEDNKQSIDMHGIDVRIKYPKRVETVSYWAEQDALLWAIAKMSHRWQRTADRFVVYWTGSGIVKASKFFDKGIYRVPDIVPKEKVWGGVSTLWFLSKFSEGQTMIGAAADWTYKQSERVQDE